MVKLIFSKASCAAIAHEHRRSENSHGKVFGHVFSKKKKKKIGAKRVIPKSIFARDFVL